MKAERRHELQTNALAKVVKRAPDTWQQYGGKILLGLVAIVLIVLLIRFQITTSREGRRATANNLAIARQSIDQLRDAVAGPGRATPQQVASIRRQAVAQAETAISSVIESGPDATTAAEALIARGDLNWTIARLPELPGAATQPTLKYEGDPKSFLDVAAESYNAVVNQYADQTNAVIAARFGLAAIAENRAQWDDAKKTYEAIEKNEAIGAAYRTQARVRLASIDRWSQTPTIAAPSTAPVATTNASTQSAVPAGPLGPVVPSTSAAPATAPAAPASIPAAPATTAPAAPAAVESPNPPTAPSTSPTP